MLYISTNIKILRKEKRISQAQLATLLGVVPGTISNYENGVSEPDLKIVEEMTKILGVSAQDLLYIDLSKEKIKTKIPENIYNENVDKFVDINVDKRKFRKTSTNKQYKITGNTPPIAADPPTPYLDSQPQQGKGRIIDSSYLEIEIPPERRGIRNMFSGFTDEEIEKAMSEEFVNNVLEMFKTGEAVSPSTMKDTINEIVKQKDAEINELRAKLWQYESTFGSISPGDNKPPALHVDNSDKRNPDK